MRLHKHTNKTWHSLILIIRVYCFAGIGEGVMEIDPSSGRVKKRSSCSQYLAKHGSGQEHCLEKRNWQSLGVHLFYFSPPSPIPNLHTSFLVYCSWC